MPDKITREKAVLSWLISGIRDFYIASYLNETHLMWHSPFYYAQGLEKICKGYLLGHCAKEYENKQENEARRVIDKIARGYSHDLDLMIEELIDLHVLHGEIKNEKEFKIAGHVITGNDSISILKKIYIENRYPVPIPSSKGFPIDEELGVYFDPIHSSTLKIFAYTQGLTIIKAAEQNFNLKEGINYRIEKMSQDINANEDDSWERFCKVFFKN